MKLSLSFPADLTEIEAFVLAARTLGASVVEVHIDHEPIGHDVPDDSTELVVIVPNAPGVAVVAEPVVEPPAPVRNAARSRVKSPPPPPRPAVDPARSREKSKDGPAPGSCGHAILTAVANVGGTFEGSAADLARAHGTGTERANGQMVSTLERRGLLSTDRISPRRVRSVSLTGDGWRALGRTPARTPAASGRGTNAAPNLAAVPDPPAMPDLGPIEKRAVDHDAARLAAASAL